MIRRVITMLALCCATLAAAVPAAAQTSAVVPKPPVPDLSALQFKVGTWTCTWQSSRRPTPLSATVTYNIDPTGYWLLVESSSKGTTWFPYSSTSQDHITYDAKAKHWIDIETDSLGGYDVSVSAGPVGNAWTWHDLSYDTYPDVAQTTDTIETKVSNSETTSTSSFTTAAGKTVTVTGSCTKTT